MKKIILLSIFCFSIVLCSTTKYGNKYYHDNGTTSTTYGNKTYHSNGTTSTRYGNKVYGTSLYRY